MYSSVIKESHMEEKLLQISICWPLKLRGRSAIVVDAGYGQLHPLYNISFAIRWTTEYAEQASKHDNYSFLIVEHDMLYTTHLQRRTVEENVILLSSLDDCVMIIVWIVTGKSKGKGTFKG